MTKSLLNLCSVVTGSTSGIGLGIARTLLDKGAKVTLNGFGDTSTLLKSLKTEFNDDRIFYHNADMTKPSEIRDMIETSVQHFGRLDILVNNAGIQHTSPIDQFDDDMWEKILKINLSAPFYATKAAFPHMKRAKFGRIVNMASVHGLVASVDKAPYVSAKHGLIGLTKATALEGANFGITCNAICPGWVLTDLVRKQIDDVAAKHNIDVATASKTLLQVKQPLHRFAETSEIGDAVVFLCGASSSSITGTCLEISGGWTAH